MFANINAGRLEIDSGEDPMRCGRGPERHGRHRAPFDPCHAPQADGSPELAVIWQSAETDAGAPQLELQKASRLSQLGSGVGFAVGTPAPASDPLGADCAVQAPRFTL